MNIDADVTVGSGPTLDTQLSTITQLFAQKKKQGKVAQLLNIQNSLNFSQLFGRQMFK